MYADKEKSNNNNATDHDQTRIAHRIISYLVSPWDYTLLMIRGHRFFRPEQRHQGNRLERFRLTFFFDNKSLDRRLSRRSPALLVLGCFNARNNNFDARFVADDYTDIIIICWHWHD
jgi:hypothetical protein